MVFKRFYINCSIRVLSLSATICLLAYVLVKTDFIAAAIFLGLIAVYQIYALPATSQKQTRILHGFYCPLSILILRSPLPTI
jgi:hypothetical protein